MPLLKNSGKATGGFFSGGRGISLFLQTLSCAILLVFTWLMLKITIPYFTFKYDVDFLLSKQTVLHSISWRWAFYTHISTSIFVLFLGIFQFLPDFLSRFPKLHRNFGKAYVALTLLFSAPSGLVMSFYANGGFWAKVSFVIMSLLWFLFTLLAFTSIRNKKTGSHINFMIRSYALTLSAITFRSLVVILPVFWHLHGKEMYVTVTWLSWIPNLIIAEVLISRKAFRLKKEF